MNAETNVAQEYRMLKNEDIFIRNTLLYFQPQNSSHETTNQRRLVIFSYLSYGGFLL